MKINKKIVKHIANLAKLKLSNDEEKIYIKEIEEIILLIDKLNKINTKNISSVQHFQNLKNIFRKDLITKKLHSENSIVNSLKNKDNYFQIPEVLK